MVFREEEKKKNSMENKKVYVGERNRTKRWRRSKVKVVTVLNYVMKVYGGVDI
jgi:hypothetical protein